MKKFSFIFLAMVMVFSLATVDQAQGFAFQKLQLVGRELSPGVESDGVFYGALFLGKMFNEDFEPVGYFSVLLDRVAENVEVCGQMTEILKLKLIMNFNDRNRLVLLLNIDQPDSGIPGAFWGYDDEIEECYDGCTFPGYAHYLEYLYSSAPPETCNVGDDSVSLIAEVGAVYKDEDEFYVDALELSKQQLGSWGWRARYVTGADISGWLVHTPLLIPAVFGTVTLYYPNSD